MLEISLTFGNKPRFEHVIKVLKGGLNINWY